MHLRPTAAAPAHVYDRVCDLRAIGAKICNFPGYQLAPQPFEIIDSAPGILASNIRACRARRLLRRSRQGWTAFAGRRRASEIPVHDVLVELLLARAGLRIDLFVH